MTEQYNFTLEDYESLYKALNQANTVCPPDEYQQRQNFLSRKIAEFLLKPYEYAMKQKKLKDA